MKKLGELFTLGIWPFLKTLGSFFIELNRRWNEGWLLLLGFALWKYADHVLSIVDPTIPPLPVNDLMRFLYATIGTCVAHFMVSVMLRISHPMVFRYLYAGFYYDLYNESLALKSSETLNRNKCARLKYSLLLLVAYLATWVILAATY